MILKLNRRSQADRLTPTPLAVAIAAVIGTGSVGHAFAQNTVTVDIDELVVTASRRETTIQELPFNVAVLTGDTLESRRLTNLTELARWIPGLTVVNQGPRGSNLMTARGLNVLSLNGSEFLGNSSGDSVATYLGEIPLYVDFKMKDLDRVEVLLGPQGTLYGAGTLGGAVRYLPKAPDTQAFSADLHGDLHSLSHSDSLGYEAGAAFNVPIVEGKLALRAAVSRLDDPGFIDYPYLVIAPGVSNPQPDFTDPADVAANVRRENDVDWEETTSARVALLWEISDSVQATFNYYFQNQDVGGRTVNHRHAFQTGRYESAQRFLEPNERKNDLFSVEIVADLGFAQLVSATGSSSFDQAGQRDQTDLLLDIGAGYESFPAFSAFTRDESQEERINQELRLVSSGDGPWGWIAGVFYNELKFDALSEEYTPGWAEFNDISLPTGDLEYQQFSRQELSEKALFGEVSYAITEALTVAVGGRSFEYDDYQRIAFTIPFAEDSNDQPNAVGDSGFLGKLNVSYDFSDDIMGYTTLSEGYRIGGLNSIAPCILPLDPEQNVCALPDEIRVDPDTTTNFELGAHSLLRDGTLVLNASIYTIDWSDIQTQSVTENGDVPITVNGGKARSRGLELGLQTRGGDHWTFSGSYSYNDAELTEDAPGLVDDADASAGDRLSGAPQHQASFAASYNTQLANGWALEAGYGLTATSDVLTKVGSRSEGETLGGYTVHSASLSLSQDRWTASLYADNLTDKFAETSVRLDPSYIREVDSFQLRRYFRDVLRPRSVGIEFRYRLGE